MKEAEQLELPNIEVVKATLPDDKLALTRLVLNAHQDAMEATAKMREASQVLIAINASLEVLGFKYEDLYVERTLDQQLRALTADCESLTHDLKNVAHTVRSYDHD